MQSLCLQCKIRQWDGETLSISTTAVRLPHCTPKAGACVVILKLEWGQSNGSYQLWTVSVRIIFHGPDQLPIFALR